MVGPPAPAAGSDGARERGLSPVVGVALLVLVTALLAGVVGVATLSERPTAPVPRAAFDLRVDAATDRIALTHRGGDPVAVAELAVEVTVDGEPLTHQPPVPFFAARGFVSGPTGPFNSADEGQWTAGETAAVRIASTNSPGVDPGDRVRVELSVERGRIAVLSATA